VLELDRAEVRDGDGYLEKSRMVPGSK